MSDPVTLATAAVAVLSPYFVAGAKKFAEKVGEDTYAKTKNLVVWLRNRLSVNHDGDLEKALDRVQADPTNTDKTAALRVSLGEFLTTNRELADELESMLPSQEEIKAALQMTTVGDNNTTIQSVGHNININANRS